MSRRSKPRGGGQRRHRGTINRRTKHIGDPYYGEVPDGGSDIVIFNKRG